MKAVGGVDFRKYALLALLYGKHVILRHKSPITLAILILWSFNSYHMSLSDGASVVKI